ncbi:MAG: type II toxin-antitoxin system VapB family antitoxin [Chthoniobacterales bacterium]
MRTTININDALLDEVRRRAGAAGRPFRQVLEEIIALGLASSMRTKTQRRVRIRPPCLALKPVYRKLS